jgi:beta propeller repeat protein
MVAVAGVTAVVHADVVGTVQQVGALPGSQQTAPAVSGSGVVWSNLSGSNYDIYFQDLAVAGSVPTNLTNTPLDNEFLEDISNGNVVWTHTGSGSDGDIVVWDGTKQFNVASAVAGVHYAHPAIGPRVALGVVHSCVVYERISGSGSDIALWDSVDGGSPITNDPAVQSYPRVDGDIIVYEDYTANPASPSVVGYFISTNTYFTVANPPARRPDVSGNNIVYVGSDSAGNDQIFLYDVGQATTRVLTTAASHKQTPKISGTRIIWADDRNAQGWDIYTFDLGTGVEGLLAGGPNDQFLADIDGDRVVYTVSDATGATTVWQFTFTPPIPVGCDPTFTDLASPAHGPVLLSIPGTTSTTQKFTPLPGHTYYMCVENGDLNGTVGRTSTMTGTLNGQVVLQPSNFQPASNPPRYVAVTLTIPATSLSLTVAARGSDDDDDDDRCDRDRDDRHGRSHHHGRGDDDRSVKSFAVVRGPVTWGATLFGNPATVRVSVRVSK